MSFVVELDVLAIAYEIDGRSDGWPVILSHGFPYDVRAFDEVVPILTAAGAQVIRPYQRGFGPTRFLSQDAPRVGQQAALGSDLIALVTSLGLERPILAGYDWGGLASCVATALWPEHVGGLVSMAGYDIIDIEDLRRPAPPSLEHVVWYQHLFQTERGRQCLALHRRELCRLLWEQWSPGWKFDQQTFERTAVSFDNPDFVDVVIHAYRHAFGLAAGEPTYQHLEDLLATRPKIVVPAVTMDGAKDPLKPGGTAHHADMFVAGHQHRKVDAGHNVPQEAPEAFADAVLTVRGWLP
ncbi:pimeloyl-ACP methyl ester carboxylesterase [Sphingomonas zeicaulis]|uniref:alpha/beta fold hydrolase n=1 Tax=Sphingomonas zeicaulis TaxID=1632740 RepID=UPI003D1C62AE